MRKALVIWGAVLFCAVLALAMLFPLFWMFSSSLKAKSEIFVNPPVWIPLTLHWENFGTLFKEYHFGNAIWNTAWVTLVYTAGTLFFCALAGFAFAKYRFRGQTVLFMIVLGSMMVPGESTMVPLFIVYRSLGLIDNLWGIVLPGLASAFGIFFMRQYASGIHTEMLEASRVDGCSEFRLFFSVALPNLVPALASLGIINFVNQWNNFLWPMIILRSADNLTLAVAIKALESGVRTPYQLILAGSTLSVLPLLLVIFLFQKHLISGLMEGSVKG